MRVWIWTLEFALLVVTIFVCVRVGAPDLLCNDLPDPSSSTRTVPKP